MRVLHDARDRDWKRERYCKECSSELEIIAGDLTFVADSRDGNAYTFTCPVCKHVNWISASLVPKGIVR